MKFEKFYIETLHRVAIQHIYPTFFPGAETIGVITTDINHSSSSCPTGGPIKDPDGVFWALSGPLLHTRPFFSLVVIIFNFVKAFVSDKALSV